MSFSELVSAMAQIAEGKLSCGAEGYLRRFILLGMISEKKPADAEPMLAYLAEQEDARLAEAAKSMLEAGLSWKKLIELYYEHLTTCEACAVRDEYHRRKRASVTMANRETEIEVTATC